MGISRRRARRQQRLRTLVTAGVGVLSVVGLSAVVVVGTATVRFSRSPIVLPVPSAPLVEDNARPVFNGTFRPVYRHSIVPGGVYSAEEVQAAMMRDPSVAEHYAKLDSAHVVGAILERPREVYVSYRVGHRIRWTSGKIVLPAGERLLTDGTRVIRARCGNLVSETRGDEQGVADASGERLDPAELDQQMSPPLVVRRAGLAVAAPAPALDAPFIAAGGTPVELAAPGLDPDPNPGPFFQPVAGVLPPVLGGSAPTDDTPGGPEGGLVGSVDPGDPDVPEPPTTTGLIEPTTTTGASFPNTTTETAWPTTTSTPFTPTTGTSTTGTIPEPSQLALLVLAWVAFRYHRRS